MKKPELLAPAGSIESFYAAIEAGCDAVYMAGYTFGARAFASNFSDEEIVEAIKYAHLYGVKVYITVNTMIYEDEVEMFMNYVAFLHKNNVDALIISDLGMFDLVRKTYPNLELHISTQMHIHNKSGALLMQGLGAKRVVLARETSIDTIKDIKENSKIELEVFVHGALCFSYSGQCLMSSLIGGRSGNRGKCAGTCRLPYNIVDENNQKINKNNYPISMKDLCTIENIGKLIDIGVDSFKIEGRMKRPEYVYLVVSLYRKAIDNYLNNQKTGITDKDILELKKIYNRKFTNGYLFNEKDVVNAFRPNHLGIEIGKVIKVSNGKVYIKLSDNLSKNDGIRFLNKKEDTGLTINKMFCNNKSVLNAYKGDTICINTNIDVDINSVVIKTTDYEQISNLEKILKNKKRYVPIKGNIKIKCDDYVTINISDDTNNVSYKSSFKVSKAINKPITKDDVLKQFNKTNDTVYKFINLDIEIDNNSFIPVSSLNELRRKVLELLNEKRIGSSNYQKNEYEIELSDYEHVTRKNAYIDSLDMYKKIKNQDFYNIYMKEDLYEKIDDVRKTLRLERVTKENKGGINILVSEIGSLMDGSYSDFSFNVANSYTVAFLHSLGIKRVTLSHELTDKQIEDLMHNYIKRYNKKPNIELIVYGYIEAMISKYNLLENLNLNKKYFLEDKFHNKFRIIRKNDLTTIYYYEILDKKNINYYYDLGINYLRYEYIDK